MLERDPEKRLDLMDFMETEYYRMEDETFNALVEEYTEKNKPKEEAK